MRRWFMRPKGHTEEEMRQGAIATAWTRAEVDEVLRSMRDQMANLDRALAESHLGADEGDDH